MTAKTILAAGISAAGIVGTIGTATLASASAAPSGSTSVTLTILPVVSIDLGTHAALGGTLTVTRDGQTVTYSVA